MIALIEDEKEKSLALLDALELAGFAPNDIEHLSNVRDAVLAVEKKDYSLIVLDVSLPTFSPGGMTGSAGRAQQQSGGLEILRALQYAKKYPNVIIVTQYPDIIFNRTSVRLEEVRKFVKSLYGQRIIDVILYREADPIGWRTALNEAVRKN